jgi:hypothetical protein
MPVAAPEAICIPYWLLASALASGGGSVSAIVGVLWARNNRLTDNTERRLDAILATLTEGYKADEPKRTGS